MFSGSPVAPSAAAMLLYQTTQGPVVHSGEAWHPVVRPWDELVNDDNLHGFLIETCAATQSDQALAEVASKPLKPIGSQELWAAGVTYLRSKSARMEESETAGGGSFYDKVYVAERPEIFFKATPHRIVGPGESMRLRRDSKWMVPEPELVLVVTRTGKIVGYTAGNDLSCRDIEGENPLYLPQAKTFDRCAALGPAILVSPTEPAASTPVSLAVTRGGKTVVEGSTTLLQMKRKLMELVGFLFRENVHPNGVYLMTGTGIIPEGDFTLNSGDVVEITIGGIGTLTNVME